MNAKRYSYPAISIGGLRDPLHNYMSQCAQYVYNAGAVCGRPVGVVLVFRNRLWTIEHFGSYNNQVLMAQGECRFFSKLIHMCVNSYGAIQ